MDYKSILITGGTGSFGRALLDKLLSDEYNFSRVVIFSRDELKQFEMQALYPHDKYPQLRFFLGDVRDQERLNTALKGIDVVVHAAALKQVVAAEYNPYEFIKTNILGAQNLISACIANRVKKVVALSTDKAAAPINLYGATKLCSDKLFIASNNITGVSDYSASVVRYGNVLGSRGSVIPFFLGQRRTGRLSVTHPEMTRFSLSLSTSVEFVLGIMKDSYGGEIFIPKIPSYRILDLVKAISPKAKIDIIGIRAGEKLHEEMITKSDALNTIDLTNKYAILPNNSGRIYDFYAESRSVANVPPGFRYNSGENEDFLDVEQIRHEIKLHLDPDFE